MDEVKKSSQIKIIGQREKAVFFCRALGNNYIAIEKGMEPKQGIPAFFRTALYIKKGKALFAGARLELYRFCLRADGEFAKESVEYFL